MEFKTIKNISVTYNDTWGWDGNSKYRDINGADSDYLEGYRIGPHPIQQTVINTIRGKVATNRRSIHSNFSFKEADLVGVDLAIQDNGGNSFSIGIDSANATNVDDDMTKVIFSNAYKGGLKNKTLNPVYNNYNPMTPRNYDSEFSNWSQVGQTIIGENAGDKTGTCTALNAAGDIVVVSGDSNDDNGVDAGHCRVFQNINNVWTQLGSSIEGENAGDKFSINSCAINDTGDIIAIGSYLNDDGGNNAGHVKVFQYSGGSWTQLGSTLQGANADDNFGRSISLNAAGNILVVGAPISNFATGYTAVYQYSSSSWSQLGSNIVGDSINNNFGLRVACNDSGTKILIGAPKWSTRKGYFKAYEYTSGSWSQLGTTISYTVNTAEFGQSLDMNASGDIVAIGARYADINGSNSGLVRTYQFSSGSWTQIGQSIEGSAASDRLGRAIALSSDGTVLAVGGLGANFHGFTKVYKFSAGLWTQIGSTIQGANADQEGKHVDLSSDGRILATTAVFDDNANGVDAGNVKIYTIGTNASFLDPGVDNTDDGVSTNIGSVGPEVPRTGGQNDYLYIRALWFQRKLWIFKKSRDNGSWFFVGKTYNYCKDGNNPFAYIWDTQNSNLVFVLSDGSQKSSHLEYVRSKFFVFKPVFDNKFNSNTQNIFGQTNFSRKESTITGNARNYGRGIDNTFYDGNQTSLKAF